MRRLILVAGLWLGLLGIVQPLLACAVNPAMVDCCPDDMQTPCDSGTDQTGTSHRSAECCATAPVTNAAVITIDSRDTPLAAATGGHTADDTTLVAVHWPISNVDSRHLTSRIPLCQAASGDADIYLHTGRLRL